MPQHQGGCASTTMLAWGQLRSSRILERLGAARNLPSDAPRSRGSLARIAILTSTGAGGAKSSQASARGSRSTTAASEEGRSCFQIPPSSSSIGVISTDTPRDRQMIRRTSHRSLQTAESRSGNSAQSEDYCVVGPPAPRVKLARLAVALHAAGAAAATAATGANNCAPPALLRLPQQRNPTPLPVST